MKEIKTSNAPAAIGPYSQAIVVGNMLFTSGQIPIDPKRERYQRALRRRQDRLLQM